jgi:hypothetical protein
VVALSLDAVHAANKLITISVNAAAAIRIREGKVVAWRESRSYSGTPEATLIDEPSLSAQNSQPILEQP